MKPLSDVAMFPINFISKVFMILGDKKLLFYCLIPLLVGIGAFITSVFLSVDYRDQIVSLIFSSAPHWVLTILSWGFVLLSIIISGVLSLFVSSAVNGFIIEEFIDELLLRKKLKAEVPFSITLLIRATLRGLVDSGRRLLLVIVVLLLIFVAGLFLPLYIFSLVFSALLIGADLFYLPLTLLNIPFRSRIEILKSHKWDLFLFGGFFSLILLIPLGGILFLPVMYGLAVDRIGEWQLTKD